MSSQCSGRRRFLRIALASAAVPVLSSLSSERAHAALPMLPVTNAQAKALNYVEDAKTVKHALYKPGSTCANCQLFTAATGACALFPGFAVAAPGWCSAWAKKA